MLNNLAVGNISKGLMSCGIKALGKVGGSMRVLLIENDVKVASLVER